MKLVLGMEVGLSTGAFELDGNPVPFSQNGQSPLPISAHFYCGQTAACIKIPLGMELGLGPSDIVLDGDPALPPQKGGTAPCFRPMSIVAKRLDVSRWHLARRYRHRHRPHCARWGPLGRELGLGPSDIVLDGDPAPLHRKGGTAPPMFGPCLLWPNGRHLSYCWSLVTVCAEPLLEQSIK